MCIAVFALLFITPPDAPLRAQNVGIGTATPTASALLELTSTSQGLLIPRMAGSQMTGIASPATGNFVFNTTANGFYYFDGAAWVPILGSNTAWGLTGNTGTTSTTNFLGTTDNVDFRIKTRNAQIFALTASGNVGIGPTVTAPTHPFEVIGDAPVNIHTAVFRSSGTKTGIALGGDNMGGPLTAFGSVQAFSGFSGTSVGVTLALQSDLGGKVVIGDTLPAAMLDIAGDLDIRSNTITPGTTNTALAIGGFSFIRLTPAGVFSIAGITGGVDGKIVVLCNRGPSNMTIINESGTATAANRINTLTGLSILTAGEGTITLMYSTADSRWIVIGVAL
jgi:hypothetical protein